MCTFIIYHDPASKQPLTMASTRDEDANRKTTLPQNVNWRKPETYTPFLGKRLNLNFLAEAPLGKDGKPVALSDAEKLAPYTNAQIQGPQDAEAGGTFAAINKHGVVAAMNNREVGLLAHQQKWPRGGLVLDALTFRSARAAAEAIFETLKPIQKEGLKKYPAFNLIIADSREAYIIQNGPKDFTRTTPFSAQPMVAKSIEFEFGTVGGKHILSLERIPPRQLVMLCGWGMNHEESQRTRNFLPQFQKLIDNGKIPYAKHPDEWKPWLKLMRPPKNLDEIGNAYDNSIAQPGYEVFKNPFGSEKATWKTLSTALFSVSYKGNARMYFCPTAPTAQMHFSAIHTSKGIETVEIQVKKEDPGASPPAPDTRILTTIFDPVENKAFEIWKNMELRRRKPGPNPDDTTHSH